MPRQAAEIVAAVGRGKCEVSELAACAFRIPADFCARCRLHAADRGGMFWHRPVLKHSGRIDTTCGRIDTT